MTCFTSLGWKWSHSALCFVSALALVSTCRTSRKPPPSLGRWGGSSPNQLSNNLRDLLNLKRLALIPNTSTRIIWSFWLLSWLALLFNHYCFPLLKPEPIPCGGSVCTAPSSVLVQTSLGFSVSGWACPAWLLGLAPGCAKISSQTPSAYTHPVTTQVPAPHPACRPALPFVVFNDRVLLRSIKTPPSHFSVDSVTPEYPVGSPWSYPREHRLGAHVPSTPQPSLPSPLPWLCLPRKPLPDESSASASGGDLRPLTASQWYSLFLKLPWRQPDRTVPETQLPRSRPPSLFSQEVLGPPFWLAHLSSWPRGTRKSSFCLAHTQALLSFLALEPWGHLPSITKKATQVILSGTKTIFSRIIGIFLDRNCETIIKEVHFRFKKKIEFHSKCCLAACVSLLLLTYSGFFCKPRGSHHSWHMVGIQSLCCMNEWITNSWIKLCLSVN